MPPDNWDKVNNGSAASGEGMEMNIRHCVKAQWAKEEEGAITIIIASVARLAVEDDQQKNRQKKKDASKQQHLWQTNPELISRDLLAVVETLGARHNRRCHFPLIVVVSWLVSKSARQPASIILIAW